MYRQIIYSLLVLASVNVLAQKGQGQVIEKVVAKIDNEILLLSELETAYIQYKQSGNPVTSDVKCKVLETLIINKLLVAKAQIDSVTIENNVIDQEVDRRVEYVLNQFGGDEAALLKQYGKNMAQIKDEMRPQIKEQMISQRMQQKITGNIKLTPKEIKTFYNKIPKDSLPFISTELEVGQIVIKPTPSANEENNVYNRLLDIKKRVEKGEDFCQFAKYYSEDPGSKGYCGRLGYRKRGELVPEFEATSLSLQPGEISEPVKSQFGYHLIRLIDRRGTEYASQHILISPKTDSRDVESTVNKLDSIRNVIIESDSLTFDNLAKKFNEDEKSKSFGNRLTDQTGNSKVSAEDIDPEVYFTLDEMKEGDISAPIKFSTPDGKKGVKLLYLISKKAPHAANLNDDYQKITKAATEAKKAEVLDEWFKKTLPEVYIYIDPEYANCNVLK